MKIPDRLKSQLCTPFCVQHDAFPAFLTAIGVLMPMVHLESQKRYSAFYYGRSPFVYIDPQSDYFKLGFFRNYVNAYAKLHADDFCAFPQWNTSRGGLIGFRLAGFDEAIRDSIAVAGMLLVTSFQRISGWPSQL